MSFKDNRRKKDDTLLNENIKFKEVRCSSSDGENYGIISSSEALNIARESGLELVCIAPNGNPPVVKIMDYGKFKYEKERKKKEARKNQKIIVTKEIKLSVKIQQNDIDYKIKHAREFILKANHVKFRVFLRGREMANPDAGAEVLRNIWPLMEDIALIENPPKFEGRYVNMLLVPIKK